MTVREKITQREAQYVVPAKTNNCRDCQFYIPGGFCVKVEFPISPAGGCKLFEEDTCPKA